VEVTLRGMSCPPHEDAYSERLQPQRQYHEKQTLTNLMEKHRRT